MPSRILGGLPYLFALLLVAGIVHICAILLMPGVAPNDAFARVARLAQPFTITHLPPAAPGQELMPFEDPSLAQAVCRYDLSQGPLHVAVAVANEGLVSIAFHARTGRVFYAMTDRAAQQGAIDVLVVTQKQLETLEAEDAEDEPPKELRLLSPSNEGFVLIRALIERPGDAQRARAQAASALCDLLRNGKNPR